MNHCKGLYINYVTHFLLSFDNQLTYSKALTITVRMNHHNKVFDGNLLRFLAPGAPPSR